MSNTTATEEMMKMASATIGTKAADYFKDTLMRDLLAREMSEIRNHTIGSVSPFTTYVGTGATSAMNVAARSYPKYGEPVATMTISRAANGLVLKDDATVWVATDEDLPAVVAASIATQIMEKK